MNNCPLALAAAWLLTTCAPLFAQHTEVKVAKSVLPSEPLIAKVPENAHWTVIFYYTWELDAPKLRKMQGEAPPATKKQPTRLVRKVQASFMKGALLEQTQFSDDSSTERLISHGWVAEQNKGEETPVVDRLVVLYPDTPFRPGKFNEFDWITPELFVGETTYRGHPCFVYREMRPSSATGKERVLRSAYISRETRLPVAIEDFTGIRLYQFEPKGEAVPPPPSLIAAIEKYQMAVKNRSKKYRLPE